QVDAPVAERAFAELARPCQARAEFAAARQQPLQQHRAAMGLQFDHVLAGIAARRVETQRDAVVDGVAAGIAAAHVPRLAWRPAAERRGAPKRSWMPSWMVWRPASRKRACRAWRGARSRAHRARAFAWLRGPDTRAMPTPPAPAGVAIAAMVSPAAMASGLGGRLAILAQHPPLLHQAEAAVGDPVQHEA